MSRVSAELAAAGREKEAFTGTDAVYERESVASLDALLAQMLRQVKKLEEDLTVSEVPGDVTKLARYCVETVLPDMAALRCVADEMESIAPTDRWPYPSYGELLFGVR